MALIRMPNQRDIVEVQYEFPNKKVLTHMVIVISHEDLHEAEQTFYGVVLSTKIRQPEYEMLLSNDMLTKPLKEITYIKTHLVQSFHADEITKHNISTVKVAAFENIKQRIFASLFLPLP